MIFISTSFNKPLFISDSLNTFIYKSKEDIEENYSDIIDSLNQSIQKFYKTSSSNTQSIISSFYDYKEVLRTAETVSRNHFTLLIILNNKELFEEKVLNFFNEFNIENEILDKKFIFFNYLIIPFSEIIEEFCEDVKFTSKIEKFHSYSHPQSLFQSYKNLYELNCLYRENCLLNSEEKIKNIEIHKKEKIRELETILQEFTNIKHHEDSIFQSFIFEIMDNLKDYGIINREIKEIFSTYFKSDEIEDFIYLYSYDFLFDKAKEFYQKINSSKYHSPLIHGDWLKIINSSNNVLVEYLKEFRKEELYKFLSILDSIIRLNFQDFNKLKEENINIEEFTQSIYNRYTKRYKCIHEKISEIQSLRIVKNNEGYQFNTIINNEIEGVVYKIKNNSIQESEIIYISQKEEGGEYKVYHSYSAIEKYLKDKHEKKFITYPYLYTQSIESYKNTSLIEQMSIDILFSLKFLFRHKTDNIIFKLIQIQLFNSDTMDYFNSSKEEERLQFIIEQTVYFVKYLKNNYETLMDQETNNYEGNNFDLLKILFMATLFVKSQIKDNEKLTYQYINGIKNSFINIFNEKEIEKIHYSFPSGEEFLAFNFFNEFNFSNKNSKNKVTENLEIPDF